MYFMDWCPLVWTECKLHSFWCYLSASFFTCGRATRYSILQMNQSITKNMTIIQTQRQTQLPNLLYKMSCLEILKGFSPQWRLQFRKELLDDLSQKRCADTALTQCNEIITLKKCFPLAAHNDEGLKQVSAINLWVITEVSKEKKA